MSDTIEFGGREFRIADRIGLMPLMRFAKVAKGGTDSSDMDGLTAMYDLLEQCIADEDWADFERVAVETRAQPDEFWRVVRETMQVVSGRPTSRPSDSSDGPTIIEPKSEDASYLRVVKRLEDEGRPDQALMVQMAGEAQETTLLSVG